jgi:hypothetical protein
MIGDGGEEAGGYERGIVVVFGIEQLCQGYSGVNRGCISCCLVGDIERKMGCAIVQDPSR